MSLRIDALKFLRTVDAITNNSDKADPDLNYCNSLSMAGIGFALIDIADALQMIAEAISNQTSNQGETK